MRVPEVRLRAAFVALVAPLATAGCLGATYGTGVPVTQQTVQDISDLMAIGGPEREEIVYKPRGAKVVVPPTDNLPPPRERVTASAGGEWPNDPDLAAKRAQAALAAPRDANPNNPTVRPPVVTDASLAATAAAAGVAPPGMDPAAYQAGVAAMAAARSKQGGTTDAEGAPVRKYLIEPPTEYRVPAQKKPVAVAPAAEPAQPAQPPPQGILANLWPWGKPAQ